MDIENAISERKGYRWNGEAEVPCTEGIEIICPNCDEVQLLSLYKSKGGCNGCGTELEVVEK